MNKNNKESFGFGTQIRKSPFFDATVSWGAKDFSVYNHMYIPRDFGNPELNFWNLIESAILCDVSVERQVEIKGADAAKFIQYLTPRDLSKCQIGQCKYVLITDENGGILNDPVLLKLGKNHFWLSLADSDILLWAKGVAINSDMDVEICEPDVSPLQLQGPKSREIIEALFGKDVAALRYYWFTQFEFEGIPLLVSRTGWSSELGYEIFLCNSAHGNRLWNIIMEVGVPFGLKPGHTSTIRRIEGGMLSYHADLNSKNNPFELGLGRLVNLNQEANFIGKTSLKKIKETGISIKQVGLIIDCKPFKSPNKDFWPCIIEKQIIGKVTSAVYSPRLKKNIALAMININFSELGETLEVKINNSKFLATVVETPFFDPQKSLIKA
mgnify:CR=1 FL=1